jgi:hypothetical protein
MPGGTIFRASIMKLITVPVLGLVVIATVGSFAWGYSLGHLGFLGRWILVFGAVWLVAIWQRWSWFGYVGLAASVLAGALGLWFLNLSAAWLLTGVIGALIAADLTDFRARLFFAASDDERRAVAVRHLRHLTFVALLGLALAGTGMILVRNYDPRWGLFLLLMAALGAAQVIAWARTRI